MAPSGAPTVQCRRIAPGVRSAMRSQENARCAPMQPPTSPASGGGARSGGCCATCRFATHAVRREELAHGLVSRQSAGSGRWQRQAQRDERRDGSGVHEHRRDPSSDRLISSSPARARQDRSTQEMVAARATSARAATGCARVRSTSSGHDAEWLAPISPGRPAGRSAPVLHRGRTSSALRTACYALPSHRLRSPWHRARRLSSSTAATRCIAPTTRSQRARARPDGRSDHERGLTAS